LQLCALRDWELPETLNAEVSIFTEKISMVICNKYMFLSCSLLKLGDNKLLVYCQHCCNVVWYSGIQLPYAGIQFPDEFLLFQNGLPIIPSYQVSYQGPTMSTKTAKEIHAEAQQCLDRLEPAMQGNIIDGTVDVTSLCNCIDAFKNVHVRVMSYLQCGDRF